LLGRQIGVLVRLGDGPTWRAQLPNYTGALLGCGTARVNVAGIDAPLGRNVDKPSPRRTDL
jgi:hypothetical protein